MTARTYDTMLAEARTALIRGNSVILDASWVDQRSREHARSLAHDAQADLVELQFTVPPDLADTRILQRTSRTSDATPAIRRRLALDADPWAEATTIDTTASIEETQRQVAACVGLAAHTTAALLPLPRH